MPAQALVVLAGLESRHNAGLCCVSAGPMSIDFGAAIQVHSVAEEYAYVLAHPCTCGGRWRLRMQALLRGPQGRHYDQLDVECLRCGARKSWLFGGDIIPF